MILIFFDSVSVITFFQIKNELLSFFSTLTVYTYFKVFSIDNRDFFYSFRVIFSICITLDSY